MKLRAGEWVEVKSKEEILRTLDKAGRLEGLPFMPQMFRYCGQRFRVYKRAHKTCDTVTKTGGRRLGNSVHLETRCDGDAYGGCQAGCLIFWKEDWLRRGGGAQESAPRPVEQSRPSGGRSECSEEDVVAATRVKEATDAAEEPRYVCQATCLPQFTTLLPWWDVRQYVEDYTSGNVTVGQLFRGAVYAGYYGLVQAGIGLGPALRWFYDAFQSLWGGLPFPRRSGAIPAGSPTPAVSVDLQPGEVVRIRSHKEILATLDTNGKNRGLTFDAEMVPFCRGTYRVKTRVHRFIEETTGRLITTRNPTIILDGVWCQARYSDCRMLCPRSIYSWWREIWLERAPD